MLLMSSYYVLGSIMGAADTEKNKTEKKIPVFIEF